MGADSKIEWTTHTFNPWMGCTKVAQGCTHCYAEALVKRFNKAAWGPHGTRVKTSEANWREPLRWNRAAQKISPSPIEGERAGVRGDRPRVFCASLADVFEDWQGPIVNSKGEPLFDDGEGGLTEAQFGYGDIPAPGQSAVRMDRLRRDLFTLIDATPHLDWLLLTKRPENVRRMWPMEFRDYWGAPMFHRTNVWLGTSIANQADADKNRPELLKLRDLAPVIFLSCEPLLGPITLPDPQPPTPDPYVDWVIIGGESGHGARPCDVAWIRSLVAQCQAADVPAFVKQLGAQPIDSSRAFGDNPGWLGYIDKKGGDPAEWPKDLRVREFPTPGFCHL